MFSLLGKDIETSKSLEATLQLLLTKTADTNRYTLKSQCSTYYIRGFAHKQKKPFFLKMKVPIKTVCFQCSYNKGLATQNIENGQVAFYKYYILFIGLSDMTLTKHWMLSLNIVRCIRSLTALKGWESIIKM